MDDVKIVGVTLCEDDPRAVLLLVVRCSRATHASGGTGRWTGGDDVMVHGVGRRGERGRVQLRGEWWFGGGGHGDVREGRVAGVVGGLGREGVGVEKGGHCGVLRERCHAHGATFETGKFWFDEPFAEPLWGTWDKWTVKVAGEVVYAVLLVLLVGVVTVVLLVRVVVGVGVVGTVEGGEEVSFGREGGCVWGGGKDKSRVIIRSVEIGMVW